MKNYRLDKTYFQARTFAEADHNASYWKQKSIAERLSASWFLTCHAYGFTLENQPHFDKSVFSLRKHKI